MTQGMESIRENLRDAGCDRDTVERFCACRDRGDIPGQLHILNEQRRQLVEMAHEVHNRLACLDYLRYSYNK